MAIDLGSNKCTGVHLLSFWAGTIGLIGRNWSCLQVSAWPTKTRTLGLAN